MEVLTQPFWEVKALLVSQRLKVSTHQCLVETLQNYLLNQINHLAINNQGLNKINNVIKILLTYLAKSLALAKTSIVLV
jgi:uncharacterized protein (UPF0332 family)